MDRTDEVRAKIIIEGETEYRDAVQRMKEETRSFREEIEQLNSALEREAELLKGLG